MDSSSNMNYGEKVTVKDTGETGYVWGVNSPIVFVCFPNLESAYARMYLEDELSTDE